jgi:drug/metabolite transporter (DMT)-like permease
MNSASSAPASSVAGYLLAAGACMIWAGNFVVAQGLAAHVSPVMLAFLRWSLAALVILPFSAAALWRQRALLRRHLGYLVLTALIGVTLFNTLIYIAGETSSATSMSLIAVSASLFIIFLSWAVSGERPTGRKLAGAALGACGVVLLLTQGQPARLLDLRFAPGDLWMLAAAVLWSLYTILVRHKPSGIGQLVLLSSNIWLGVLMLSPLAVWAGTHGAMLTLTPTVVGGVLYVGIAASLFAYMLWHKAIHMVGPSNAGVVYYTVPLFSAAEAFAVLGNPLTLAQAFSGVLIIGGVLWASGARQR